MWKAWESRGYTTKRSYSSFNPLPPYSSFFLPLPLFLPSSLYLSLLICFSIADLTKNGCSSLWVGVQDNHSSIVILQQPVWEKEDGKTDKIHSLPHQTLSSCYYSNQSSIFTVRAIIQIPIWVVHKEYSCYTVQLNVCYYGNQSSTIYIHGQSTNQRGSDSTDWTAATSCVDTNHKFQWRLCTILQGNHSHCKPCWECSIQLLNEGESCS